MPRQMTTIAALIAVTCVIGAMLMSCAPRGPGVSEGTTGAESNPSPLVLTLAVSLDDEPVTIVCGAQNTGDKAVSIARFQEAGNELVIRGPGEKTELSGWIGGPGKAMLTMEPGQTHQWIINAASSLMFRKPGAYRIRWKVGDQLSNEIMLLRKAKPDAKQEERRLSDGSSTNITPQ